MSETITTARAENILRDPGPKAWPVDQLRQAHAYALDEIARLRSREVRKTARIRAAVALHVPRDGVLVDGEKRCDGCGHAMPCPTLRALDAS